MTTKVTKLDDHRAEAGRELSCLEPSLSGSLENRSIRDIMAPSVWQYCVDRSAVTWNSFKKELRTTVPRAKVSNPASGEGELSDQVC